MAAKNTIPAKTRTVAVNSITADGHILGRFVDSTGHVDRKFPVGATIPVALVGGETPAKDQILHIIDGTLNFTPSRKYLTPVNAKVVVTGEFNQKSILSEVYEEL